MLIILIRDTSFCDSIANIYDEIVLKIFINTIAKLHVKRFPVLSGGNAAITVVYCIVQQNTQCSGWNAAFPEDKTGMARLRCYQRQGCQEKLKSGRFLYRF